MSTAKRLTPNKIANLVMADEAWHDSEYVAACDYDALSADLAALRAENAALRDDCSRLASYSAEESAHLCTRAEKAEAERDDALVAVKAMHKLLARDWESQP